MVTENQCLEEVIEKETGKIPSDLSQKFLVYSSKDPYLRRCVEDPIHREFYKKCLDFLKDFLEDYNTQRDAVSALKECVQVRIKALKFMKKIFLNEYTRRCYIDEIKIIHASLHYFLTGVFPE